MERTKIDNGGGYSIIHEEFAGRESENRCFRMQEITLSQWRNMTSDETLRFWRARGVSREYTAIGYMVVGYSRRRWGDGLKILDRWHVVKVGTAYKPICLKIDEVANA